MMDFDQATTRLTRDQQTALSRSRAQKAARTSSQSSKRDAAASRARAERRILEKKIEAERKRRGESVVWKMVGAVERELGVIRVNDNDATTTTNNNNMPLSSGWKLNATSIHGEGDKIALPPSTLEYLTTSSNNNDNGGGLLFGNGERPLAFRVGVLNEEYVGFPASEKMKAMVDEVYRQMKTAYDADATIDAKIIEGGNNNEALMMPSQQMKLHGNQTIQNDNDDSMDDSDHEEESTTTLAAWTEAYLDELSHRYLAYTHGTVVEFTQEEGCVGLPEPIARALLRPNAYSLVQRSSNSGSDNNVVDIPTKRTVDPAIVTSAENDDSSCTTIKQQQQQSSTRMEVDDEKTPGHPAYNAFDIPSLPIEIIPITSLPPGKDCTFTPTTQSIRNGFYDLKDIKAVLEQSLMRTRATLSRGDVIRTWRRGVCFDLMVSKLSSSSSSSLSLDYGVVSCVNTDLNVDIGVPEEEETGNNKVKGAESSSGSGKEVESSGGRTLAEPSSISQTTSTTTAQQSKQTTNKPIELPPEPPENETEGVCTIQIRGGGINTNNTSGRRRFKTNTSTMGDLFSFASNISGHDVSSFRLVTRFPRKVYKLFSLANDDGDEDTDDCYDANDLLENVGIVNGQILFMIEKL